jgi:hypothetical protein
MGRVKKKLLIGAIGLSMFVYWVLYEVASLDEIDWDIEQ